MTTWKIESVVLTDPDFDRFIAEIIVNNQIIGHIEKEQKTQKSKAILYEVADVIPQDILAQAVEHARSDLLEFLDEN